MHFKSVTHPKIPEKTNAVRADTIISGYIIEEINYKGKPSTKLTIVS